MRDFVVKELLMKDRVSQHVNMDVLKIQDVAVKNSLSLVRKIVL